MALLPSKIKQAIVQFSSRRRAEVFSKDSSRRVQEISRPTSQRIRGIPGLELGLRVWRELGDDYAVDLAASISYYAIVSLFPMVIGLVTLFTLALEWDAVEGQVFGFFHTYLPGSHVILAANPGPLNDIRSTAGILSAVALVWSSSMLFGAITRAVNRAWDIPYDRPFYTDKPLHLAMVFVVAPLFLASMATTTALQMAAGTDLPVQGYLSFLANDLINTLARVLPLAFSLVTFLLIYKFAPNVPTNWRHVWPGAVVGALLFDLTKNIFVFYMESFAAYEKVYGAFASLILLMGWIYVCGLIVVIGAEISSEHERMRLGLGRGEPLPRPTERLWRRWRMR